MLQEPFSIFASPYSQEPSLETPVTTEENNRKKGPWVMEEETLAALAALTARAVIAELKATGVCFNSAEPLQRCMQNMESCTAAVERLLGMLRSAEEGEQQCWTPEGRSRKGKASGAQSLGAIILEPNLDLIAMLTIT